MPYIQYLFPHLFDPWLSTIVRWLLASASAMPFLRVPFLQPRRSLHHLRSFHLPTLRNAQVPMEDTSSSLLRGGASETGSNSIVTRRPPLKHRVVVPLRGSTLATLSILTSLFFIIILSLSFVGSEAEGPTFVPALNTAAEVSPGVVFVGESVDVDIDEPEVSIRWSIAACGADYVLPGSFGIHGASKCGLPISALNIYVDNSVIPTATYDPAQIPFDKNDGRRRSIQNLVQFDSQHIIDVHTDRLYPFDNYKLSSTIRAVAFDNVTVIPIRKLITIDLTSSFDINTIDMASYSTLPDGRMQESRDIDMYISRPNEARFFTLLLFVISWVLAHITIGHVFIARRLHELRTIIPHLISCATVLVAIPLLRNSMPDAPGLDGILIDSIGYFPQMVISSISAISLLVILVVNELNSLQNPPDALCEQEIIVAPSPRPISSTSSSTRFSRPPSSPTATSSSMEIAQWEMYRLLKHIRGDYVFPPVKPTHRLEPSDPVKPSHRRVKTMSRIMEAGEAPRWSKTERIY